MINTEIDRLLDEGKVQIRRQNDNKLYTLEILTKDAYITITDIPISEILNEKQLQKRRAGNKIDQLKNLYLFLRKKMYITLQHR